MDELVDHDVVGQVEGLQHEAPVKADPALRRAAAPAAAHVLDGDRRRCDADRGAHCATRSFRSPRRVAGTRPEVRARRRPAPTARARNGRFAGTGAGRRPRHGRARRPPSRTPAGRRPRRPRRRRAGAVDDDQRVLAAQVGEPLAGLVAVRRKLGERVALAQLPPHPARACRAPPPRRSAAGSAPARPRPARPRRGMLMPIVRRRALRRTANVTSSTVRVSRGERHCCTVE